MYKRNPISLEDNARLVKYNPEVGLSHSILRQSSPVDVFYREECKPAHDKSPSVSYVDPIYMLFNQDRLSNLGEMTAKAFLDSLQNKEDSVAELRKKLSDEDLVAMMKSRYLQTPSEIMAYCRYIEGNVDTFNRELQTYIESQNQQTTAAIVEPSQTE